MKKDLVITQDAPQTEDRLSRLVILENQFAMGYIQLTLAIKEIDDEKLYLERDYNSMTDYAGSVLKIKPSQLSRMLRIARTFSTQFLNKAAKSKIPMMALLEASKDDEIVDELEAMDIQDDKVVYSDGTFEPLGGVISRALEREKKLAKKKLTEADSVIQGKQAIVEDYKSRLEEQKEENEKLKKVIQEITHRKDIDPRTLVYITQKKEALNVLDENSMILIRSFGAIGGIPHELIDTEVTMRLTEVIASIEAGLQRLREEYGSVVWIPGKTKSPDGFIPE